MDTTERDQRLGRLAEQQAGVFTRGQAREAGFDDPTIKARIARGAWQPVHPNVYRVAGCPPTFAAKARAALLDNGRDAVFSHLTAARLHRIDVRVPSDDVFITVPQNQKRPPRPGVIVARSRTMEGHVADVNGLPTMTLDRTVIDVGQIVDEEAMLHILYDVIRTGRTTVERLTAATERVERRAGCAMLRSLLRTFDPQYESWLEGSAARAMRAAGMTMETQVEVLMDGVLIARLDFADRRRRLAVEIDGRSHATTSGAARDKRRDRRLATLGWAVLRFDAQDVLHRTAEMIREIRAAASVR